MLHIWQHQLRVKNQLQNQLQNQRDHSIQESTTKVLCILSARLFCVIGLFPDLLAMIPVEKTYLLARERFELSRKLHAAGGEWGARVGVVGLVESIGMSLLEVGDQRQI